jgi:hypothetical protein
LSQDDREEKQTGENTVEQKKEKDIKSLLAVIPPASALKGGVKKIQEKRIRIRYGNVKESFIKISSALAEDLGISEKAYVVVGGKKRFLLNVIIDDNLPANEVYANPDLLRENGIADNSIATIRRA